MVLGQERGRHCSLRNPSAVELGVCQGTGPGKAFTLASLRQVLAGGGAGPWCLPADCGGEEPSEKEKGGGSRFCSPGASKRGATPWEALKMIY